MNDPVPVTEAELRQRILSLLTGIAPDIDPDTLRPELEFRDQVDFDSMDLFNFAAAVHTSLGIDVPEKDYRQLAALDRCMAYLRGRLASAPAPTAAS